MKLFKELFCRSAMLFLVFTIICGVFYTGLVTGLGQVLFPAQANGSLITVEGKTYGSEHLAQQFTSEKHLWGRVMKVDVSTYKDAQGKPLAYSAPSNLSPASEDYAALIKERVAQIKAAHPEQKDTPIPVELVTGSGSGLDPHISPSAAAYQLARIARANDLSEEAVAEMIEKCTTKKFLGFLGQETVNVLKVNLMLEGIL